MNHNPLNNNTCNYYNNIDDESIPFTNVHVSFDDDHDTHTRHQFVFTNKFQFKTMNVNGMAQLSFEYNRYESVSIDSDGVLDGQKQQTEKEVSQSERNMSRNLQGLPLLNLSPTALVSEREKRTFSEHSYVTTESVVPGTVLLGRQNGKETAKNEIFLCADADYYVSASSSLGVDQDPSNAFKSSYHGNRDSVRNKRESDSLCHAVVEVARKSYEDLGVESTFLDNDQSSSIPTLFRTSGVDPFPLIKCDDKKVFQGDVDDDTWLFGCNSSHNSCASSSINRIDRIRSICLSPHDEVHVTPCRCALHIFAGMSLHCPEVTPDPRLSPIETPLQDGMEVCPITFDDIKRPGSTTTTSPYRQKPSASNEKLSDFTSVDTLKHIESVPTNSPMQSINMDRNKRSMIGDHEITLVRRGEYSHVPNLKESTSLQDELMNEDYNELHESWSLITIRCQTHDEMDALIQAIKAYVHGISIVPFSYGRKRGRIPRDKRVVSRIPSVSPSIDRETPDLWNHNDLCDYCNSLFTLLSRRHHCRKCHVSVCNDCSCIIHAPGGKTIRLCNKCYQTIISKGTFRQYSSSSSNVEMDVAMSGKVHTACHALGVGISGKLPHWRNWCNLKYHRRKHSLTTFNRPAVGRITVELIQALSLPIADDVTGKSDPYVKATMTGYDLTRDLYISEWKQEQQYSLRSSFCSGTLSPIWRGTGKAGGELLTIPVISSAGAILRLEIFHYDVFSDQYSTKDKLLGIVEIPLSDLPNANLRSRHAVEYDGFVDCWYNVNTTIKENAMTGQRVPLACPIQDPRDTDTLRQQRKRPHRNAWQKALDSMDEIGQRLAGLSRAPVVWSIRSLGINVLPGWYAPVVNTSKSKACIHVRIKLNVSSFGDVISHSWTPPIIQRDKIPFDPQLTLGRIRVLSEKLRPYQEKLKFIDDVVRWRKSADICILSYAVFAFHVYFIQHFVLFLHLYLLSFLCNQRLKLRRKVRLVEDVTCTSLSSPSLINTSTCDINGNENDSSMVNKNTAFVSSSRGNSKSSSLKDLNHACFPQHPKVSPQTTADEPAQLNLAIQWVIKMIANNRGLASIQFKLGLIARDVSVLNSLWDGSNVHRIEATFLYFSISLFVHLYFLRYWRLLWITTSFCAYFSISPFFMQALLGFGRGLSKYQRRLRLHKIEVEKAKVGGHSEELTDN